MELSADIYSTQHVSQNVPFKTNFSQAAAYEGFSMQKKNGQELLQMLAPKSGMKVLDLGCGTGFQSKMMSDLVMPDGLVIAIDPDKERINFAKEKNTAKNLCYLEVSAENIPGANYDMVYSNSVLHWVKDKDSLFQEVGKCLKSGGTFGFLCSTSSEMMDTVNEETHSEDFVRVSKELMHYSTAIELKKLAIRNGFTVIEWDENNTELRVDTDTLINNYMTHFPQFDRSHFKSGAMRRKFGCGEFSLTIKNAKFILAKL